MSDGNASKKKAPPLARRQSHEAGHQPIYLAIDSGANVDQLLPKSSNVIHRRQQTFEVDAEAHISPLAKAHDSLAVHERNNTVNGDLNTSATVLVRRARSAGKMHLSTDQQPEVVPVTPETATAAAVALNLAVAAPALNEVAGASRLAIASAATEVAAASRSSSEGLLLSLTFVFLVLFILVAVCCFVYVIRQSHLLESDSERLAREAVTHTGQATRVRHTAEEMEYSEQEQASPKYQKPEAKGKKDMNEDAKHTGLLWRLANAGIARLPMENAESPHRLESALPKVSDMKLWYLRYFNIKVTDNVLTMSYLSEKDDMEPVTMLLRPFKIDRSKVAMPIGSVRTHIDPQNRAQILLDAQQYEVALETSGTTNPDVLDELPDVLHLFLVNGVRQSDVVKSGKKGKAMAERKGSFLQDDDDGEPEEMYQIYGVDSKELCQDWVSDIQNAALSRG